MHVLNEFVILHISEKVPQYLTMIDKIDIHFLPAGRVSERATLCDANLCDDGWGTELPK